MDRLRAEVDRFLVEVFNDILRSEEQSLAVGKFKNLSIRELHVIEAVCNALKTGHNQSTAIAKSLRITAGSMTAAVIPLEKKGYLYRQRDDHDKRVVRITATALGQEAYAFHDAYHSKLVDDILSCLIGEELDILVRALGSVGAFFSSQIQPEEEAFS